jgi:hypothetical protein
MIAFLDVHRPTLRLALEVGGHVGDHQLKGPAQGVDGGVGGSGAQRRPGRGPAQTQQQAVAAGRDLEGVATGLARSRVPEAVGLHELLEAGAELAGVVQHGLVGAAGQIGEQHPAPVPHVGGEALGQRDGRRGRPCAQARHCEMRSPMHGPTSSEIPNPGVDDEGGQGGGRVAIQPGHMGAGANDGDMLSWGYT